MKLSLDALKERAEAVASEELLGTISGGLEDACHDKSGGGTTRDTIPTRRKDGTLSPPSA
jgi:hypothetical protein